MLVSKVNFEIARVFFFVFLASEAFTQHAWADFLSTKPVDRLSLPTGEDSLHDACCCQVVGSGNGLVQINYVRLEEQADDEGLTASSNSDQVAKEGESLETALAPEDLSSSESPTKIGLDEWINAKFQPIANAWVGLVLSRLPGFPQVPVVLLLLVLGAVGFTIYFSFPNLRLFALAIRIVCGRYSLLEKEGLKRALTIETSKASSENGGPTDTAATQGVNVQGGDIVDTIRDEGEQGEVSHFQALATAVSGTVGLGNIAGVAVAITLGGPGATFWMMVCGFLGMSTKFVECTLGVTFRDIDKDGVVHGGPMYYLSRGLAELGYKPLGKVLGGIFAFLCIGASFGGGNMFQSNQATAQIQTLFNISSANASDGWQQSSGAIIGFVMALFVGVVIIGGVKRIAAVTEKIVPLMAILYVGAAFIIIFANLSHVPVAFAAIFAGAFSPEAGVGGLVGVIVTGFQRAAFSNEAGVGSAAIAHSCVRTRYPASEGIVALLEPFIDTVVICTMSALVIVLFNTDNIFDYGLQNETGVIIKSTGERLGGVDLTSRAFDSVLPGFRYVLTIAIILFAVSTMISWSYYGLQSWKYIFGRSRLSDTIYKVLFCIFIVIGAASSLQAVIDFSDGMILALIFPNMIGLVLLAPRIRRELNRYLAAIKKFEEAKSVASSTRK